LRRAEQRGRGERVAQQTLQRRAGKAENRADRKAENHPRQANLAHDHLRDIAAAAEQRLRHLPWRHPHRTDAERDQRQQHDQHGHRQRYANAAARGLPVAMAKLSTLIRRPVAGMTHFQKSYSQ
jgi:hypothetical protein